MLCPGKSGLALSCLLIGLLAAPVSAKKTVNVPGDAATIQAGINLASNGDTVLVAPGTYVENIDFIGKAITVTSSGGAAVTTIDGGQKGVVVNFANNESRGAVINGFTITDDAPPPPTQVPFFTNGIFVGGANPTITNNVITNNRGYGIEVYFGSAYISGNTITDTSTAGDPNQDYGCDYDDGDGIFIQGGSNSITEPPVIDHNTVEHNVGHCEGGGIGLFAGPASTVISNNIIANNQSLGYGGGVYFDGAISLYQNLIYNNVSGVAGGGVYLSMGSEVDGAAGPLTVFVTNNTIYGNTISLNSDIEDAWVDGSQVALPGYVSQLGLFNNLIVGNSSYAAIACWATYQYLSSSPPVVVNSDMRNTGGAVYGGWCTSPAGNTGNISADPKFKNPSDGDFHLLGGSPAIDSGFNAAPGPLATDLDGNPRIQNATGANETVVDMGVYEASGTPESRSSSQTTLSAQQDTVFYGQPVTLTAAVVDSSSSPVSEGTVSFLDDWSVIQQSTLNESGIAAVTTSSLGVGPHWFVASFGGNTADQPSISTATEVVVNGFSTSTAIAFSPNPGHYGQSETLTATVTLAPGNPPGTGTPTGSIAFDVSGSLLATVSLNPSGIATYTTSSLPVGTAYIQAIYQSTDGFVGSNSPNLPLEIVANPIASVEVSNPGVIATTQPLDVTITVSGTFGNPTPTGSVTLTSGSYSSGLTTLDGGSVTITVPAGSLAAGHDTLSAQYSGDTIYGPAAGTGSVTVTAPIAISGTSVSIYPGATSSNQSTITVTPSGGFTGSVTLTAAVTSSPADATDVPTLSFGSTGIVNITSDSAGTATLTIMTVAPVGCPQTLRAGSAARRAFPSGLCLGLAWITFLVTPRRGGRGHSLPMLLVLVGLTSLVACGGGGSTCIPQSPGTTPGNYTITVTGTSGPMTANGSVRLTVQ
jgi:parallel beta-helix repeat protein